MRDIIGRILEGNYIQITGSLQFSVAKVDIGVSSDCDYEGTFKVFTDDGSAFEGRVISTDMRMEILTPDITGKETEITYFFHGDLCKPGDEVRGNFGIISDHGEYTIPFVVRIEQGSLDSSLGPIRDLYNFANLARSSWNEAAEMFYSPEFPGILSGTDEKYKGIYYALSANKGNLQNLEEFLLCTGKKKGVELYYDKKVFEVGLIGVEFSEQLAERELEILRNGWGYTDIDIEIQGDFILTRRETLTEADFVGNVCTIKIFIDTEKCSRGRREGKIVLRNNFTRLEIPVVVRGRSENIVSKARRSQTVLLEKLTRDYIYHGLGLMEDKEWFDRTGANVEQLGAFSGIALYARLFKARLLVLEGRANEASWLVDQAAEMIEHDEKAGKLKGHRLLEAYAYHWLIASMVKQDKEFTKTAVGKIEAIYRKLPEDWQIAIITLSLPTTYNANTYTRWDVLERLYESGGRSGVIYYEGVKIINENPSTAKQMDDFLIQTLHFGAKLGVINQRCLEYILQLPKRSKDLGYVYLNTMELLYEKYGDNRILQEICSQLIINNRTDHKANAWYSKAIEKEIKLTKLFEYFIQSLDLEAEEDIPLVVLMYFGYKNNLASEQLAYFYYYIITHKEQYRELYEGNLQNMEFFANAQIAEGNISRHLAVIYSEVLDPSMLSRQQALGMADLIFSRWVVCEKKECEKVYVYQKGFSRPFEYKLKNGAGAISVYGSGNIIVFEDNSGNRYIESVKADSRELMAVSAYLPSVSELVWDNERLNFYLVGTGETTVTVTSANILRIMNLAESELVSKEERQQKLALALEHYSIKDDAAAFERTLKMLDTDSLTSNQRGLIFPLLLKFGHEDIARAWLTKYGPYFARVASVKRFLEKILKPSGKDGDKRFSEEYDRGLVGAGIYVFALGNAGSLITDYLGYYYDGLSRDMVEIWKALKEYGLPRNVIDRRIMLRHIFTDAYLPEINHIAKECFEENFGTDIAKAVLAQGSFRYLVGMGVRDECVIENIKDLYKTGDEVPVASKLAFLKYYSENTGKMDELSEELVLKFLGDEVDDRVYLGFFKEYLKMGVFGSEERQKACRLILGEIEDRTIVDYKVTKGKIAKIHYMITGDESENFDYASENMREVCGGICFKDFTLFFGEKLQYYITEESENEASLSDNGQVSCNDTGAGGSGGKYTLINDMLISNTTKDYARFDDLYEEYNRREFMNGELFRLM